MSWEKSTQSSPKTQLAPGDLVLVGYCLGGLLSYELATQLEKHGRSVRSVIMIDTPTPKVRLNSIGYHQQERRASLLAQIRSNPVKTLLGRTRVRLSHEMHHLPFRFWWLLTPWFEKAGLKIPAQGRSAYYQRIQEGAFIDYRPPASEIPVHLVKTARQDMEIDYGWSQFCPRLQEHFVDAPHEEMISREQAPALARLISALATGS